jgi:hypothetical protein
MLRVSPYFQVLALFKLIPFLTFMIQLSSNHIQEKMHPILLIQELQANKFKHHNNNYINQIELMELLCDDYHK